MLAGPRLADRVGPGCLLLAAALHDGAGLACGYPRAFELSLEVMAGFGLAVAALVQLLRRTS